MGSPGREAVRRPTGGRATLLHFSRAFRAPCRITRAVLSDVAGSVSGVVHVDVGAEEQLDLVRLGGLMRTPTALVLDLDGAYDGT